jgi:SlyX protein
MEERFRILETKYAYQEHEITKLSDVIFKQQLAIDKLEAQMKKITDQLRDLGFQGDNAQNQPPPHY